MLLRILGVKCVDLALILEEDAVIRFGKLLNGADGLQVIKMPVEGVTTDVSSSHVNIMALAERYLSKFQVRIKIVGEGIADTQHPGGVHLGMHEERR